MISLNDNDMDIDDFEIEIKKEVSLKTENNVTQIDSISTITNEDELLARLLSSKEPTEIKKILKTFKKKFDEPDYVVWSLLIEYNQPEKLPFLKECGFIYTMDEAINMLVDHFKKKPEEDISAFVNFFLKGSTLEDNIFCEYRRENLPYEEERINVLSDYYGYNPEAEDIFEKDIFILDD